MFNQLSLRYALPLWIILLTLLFTIGEVTYTLKSREIALLNSSQTLLQSDGNRLSAQVEQILRKNHTGLIEKQDINRLFSLYITGTTTDIILLDDNGRAITSISLYQDHKHDARTKINTALGHVRKSGSNVIISDEKHHVMHGIFSVRMPPHPGELSHNGYGTLAITISNHKVLEEEYSRAIVSILLRLSAIMIVIIAIIVFIRRRVIMPILSMSDTIHQISKGDSNARMTITLNDELGNISASFNEMLEKIEAQKKEALEQFTELQQTQQELELYKNNLEQKVLQEIAKRQEHQKIMIQQSRLAAMGEMIGNIAHQWRQPLNAMGLVVYNMKDAYDYGELTPKMMEKSTNKASALIKKMSTTIDDFRNFFKPDKTKDEFEILKTIHEIIFLVEESFLQQRINIEIDIDSSLIAMGYKNEFSQVILNLLNNSRDIFEERYINRRTIRISASQRENKIIVIVRDNGGGIPTEVLPRIFEPYYSTKEEGKGTGIGLYMSKNIIEEHHKGKLSASNDDEGAVFTLELPTS